MTFDPTKPVVCRNGWPARIICTDGKSRSPIIALVTTEAGMEYPYSYDREGYRHSGDTELDLINVPEKVTRWVWRLNDAYENNKGFGWSVEEPTAYEKSKMDTYYPIEIEVGRKK